MNKSKFTLFTASLALATALTFSCSSDDGDGNEAGLSSGNAEISSSSVVVESSSSSQTQSSSSGVNIDYGSFEHEGQTYKTVVIGTQTWMAENLNYETPDSWCYDDDDDNCDIYGRLYTWSAAMAGAASSTASPSGVQGICPSGWHLPSREEWDILVSYAGGISTAGTKLKATSGWVTGNGTDNYGFSAMPGGYRNTGGSFGDVGSYGSWWSATEFSGTGAYRRNMRSSGADVSEVNYSKPTGYSVRCLKD